MVEILEHMSALSDPTRCRMLLMLERHELTVSELCSVLQMPQSSVSRHLKTLADDNWVASRRDLTSRFYTMPLDDLDSAASRLWPLIREQVASTTAAAHDEGRLRGVRGRRRARSESGSRRHAAASPRGVRAADGPGVARVFREADCEASDGRGIRGCAGAAAAGRSRREGPRAVCGDRDTRAVTQKFEVRS